MNVIPDFKASTIIPVLTRNVASGSTIYTDGLQSFAGLVEAGFKHVARIQPLRSELRKGAKSAVLLANRAIGNLQQWLIGTYHGVSKAQLQVYLDEFVFRHNRRKPPAATSSLDPLKRALFHNALSCWLVSLETHPESPLPTGRMFQSA